MTARKTLALLGLAAPLLIGALVPAQAMAWSKSFLVEWMEPALFYAGPDNGSANAKGADCPTGVNTMDYKKILSTPFRTPERVTEINNAEYPRGLWLSHLPFRGPHKENVYENPTAAGDPGFVEVSGTIGEGLNLDDNPNTGFVSPDGEMGVDNAFYKVVGCTDFFRGKRHQAFTSKNVNEQAESRMTLLMVISGKGSDPQNDDDIAVGIYSSLDQAAKDPTARFITDYSFQINPQDQTVFKARSVGGVIEAVGRPTIKVRFSAKAMPARHYTELFQSKARIVLKADGTGEALIDGYRKLGEVYIEPQVTSSLVASTITESLGHFSLAGYFYSLRRNADGLVNPKTGVKEGISAAYRMELIPAFVIEPHGSDPVKVAQYFDGQG